MAFNIKCNLLDKMEANNWISFATKSLDDNVKVILCRILFISLCGRIVDRAFKYELGFLHLLHMLCISFLCNPRQC